VELSVCQILVSADVDEIALAILQSEQGDRQAANDLGDQLRVNDETAFDRQGRSDPTLAVNGAKESVKLADRIWQEGAANAANRGRWCLG